MALNPSSVLITVSSVFVYAVGTYDYEHAHEAAVHQVSALVVSSASTSSTSSPQKLIIDTDIGGGGCNDVDDVVAVAVANALMDNGE